MENQKTLLFIPDISGFTDFVNQTEINHSSHIISELLEILIDENNMGFSVSEIEGDAVLFFKDRNVPSLANLIEVAERMFIRFHTHLQKYEYERICRCGACRTANNLSVKFIIHTGEVNRISVGNHQKLHGKDVILAHQLLKNDVPFEEYVLFTNAFKNEVSLIGEQFPDYDPESSDASLNDGQQKYYFFSLKPLLTKIPEMIPVEISFLENTACSEEIIIKKSMDDVYFNIHDFDQRMKWNPQIKKMQLQNGNLNKAGALHQCLIGNDTLNIKTLGRQETKDKIIYAERVDNIFLFRKLIQSFNLMKYGEFTRIKIESDFKLKTIGLLVKPLIKPMLKRRTTRSVQTLKRFLENQD